MRDLHDNVKISSAVDATRVGDNTAQAGNIIDTQGFRSLEFAITATIADSDATLTPLVEHGDNSALSDNSAVADADLLGTEAGATYAAGDDGVVKKIGYKGTKRYVRLTLTPGANSDNMDLAALAIQGNPESAPQSDQAV